MAAVLSGLLGTDLGSLSGPTHLAKGQLGYSIALNTYPSRLKVHSRYPML